MARSPRKVDKRKGPIAPGGKKSLQIFVQRECKVCSLPKDVLAQIRDRPRGVTLPTVLVWLKQEYGVSLTRMDFLVHNNGRHAK